MRKKSTSGFKPRKKYSRPSGKKSDGKASPAVWDQAAKWYDTLVGMKGSDYQKSIIMPKTWALLDVGKGARVLDLACGQGVFSRFLKRKGVAVEGLDVSDELIRFARNRSSGVKFHHYDAGNAEGLPKVKYDAIACLLAVQNMEHLGPVLTNVNRWLKPKGRFVMVVTHPCFRIPRQTHWDYDEAKKIMFRRVDLYATETTIPILTPPMTHAKIFTYTYHRSLQKYSELLAEAGLMVDRLEEWVSDKASEPGKRAKAENRARNEIPLFMAIRAVPAR